MGGRSLLEWNLRWLEAAGFGPVWVNLHYRGAEVERAVAAMDLAVEIRFSAEDPILGTAGAWRKLADEWRDTSVVVYGDNVTRFDLKAFVAAHRDRAGLATIALFDPARHANTGIAGSRVVLAENGDVVGFEEVRGAVAGSALVNTGAYLLEPALVERIAPGFADFGADVFPPLSRDRVLGGYLIEDGGFCLGLDTPEHFAAGQRLVAAGVARLEHLGPGGRNGRRVT